MARLIEHIEDPDTALPQAPGRCYACWSHPASLNEQIGVLDTEIARRAKVDPLARRLMTIPGVGPIVATAIVALVPAPRTSSRPALLRLDRAHAAAEVDRRQAEAGGHLTQGERTLRRLLTIGASAVVRQALLRGAPAGSWLAQMLARKPRMLVIVALANKTARIVWALMAKGGVYRAPVAAA